ncbi:putative cytokinin 7-beta-glucosyltransferase [Helianthus annuus]|uniref:Cytokinin 7-beta-glucosyltransferase n=2 Tax=Helianthus annuus TaxID=4232 RepID=A0A9K3ECG6_HELAN|nr:putative cytokinin 7-beta-glucosyltransferase [Helianthus annuus]KAJ0842173.1 putative cytokinin 7-beta-glucosyltransferase [Helianthus annuus]
METLGSISTLQSRRIILFPLPFQGHINPMLQLANILHTRGFKITIIHAEYNSPNPSNYPHFTFKPIKDHLSKVAHEYPTNRDGTYFVRYLNKSCVDSFTDCLAGLLTEPGEERVACVITDACFYFTQAVADDMKLPRIVLRTSSLGCNLAYEALPFYSKTGSFYLTKQGSLLWTIVVKGARRTKAQSMSLGLQCKTLRVEGVVTKWWQIQWHVTKLQKQWSCGAFGDYMGLYDERSSKGDPEGGPGERDREIRFKADVTRLAEVQQDFRQALTASVKKRETQQ